MLALTAASSSVLLAGCNRSEHAEDGIYRLRVADGFTPKHPVTELVIRPFMERVEERSGGRVQFDHFPAEQLGKLRDMLRLTRWGLIDIGYIAPAFNSEKLPLSSVHDLPNALGQNIGTGVRILEALYREGSVLRTAELDPNGIRPLLYISASPAQLELSTSRRIERLADIEGLKLRIASPATEVLVKAIGATPIRMATGELFEALIRGTIDGLMVSALSADAYDLGSQFTQMTVDLNFGAIAGAYAIREQTWTRLPPDLRNILVEAGVEASREGARETQAREERAMQKILSLGVRPIGLPAEDRAELDRRIDGIYGQWAERMKDIGRQGDEALEQLARAKSEVLR